MKFILIHSLPSSLGRRYHEAEHWQGSRARREAQWTRWQSRWERNNYSWSKRTFLVIVFLLHGGRRPEALQYGAAQFESSAVKLKRKMWWKNVKVKKREEEKRVRIIFDSSLSLCFRCGLFWLSLCWRLLALLLVSDIVCLAAFLRCLSFSQTSDCCIENIRWRTSYQWQKIASVLGLSYWFNLQLNW